MERKCRLITTGAASVSLAVRTPGQRKEKPCDISSVANVLLVSNDLDDIHDVVGLWKAWPWPYPGSSSGRGFGFSRSGVGGPVVGASRSDSSVGNGEQEHRLACAIKTVA